MYTTLLTLHIIGAVIMAVITLGSLLAVVLKKSSYYSSLAGTVFGLGIVQIISGASLSFFTSTSMVVVCSKLLVYLGITIGLELLLISKISAKNSVKTVVSVSSTID